MAAVLVCGILVTACGKQGGNNADANAVASDAGRVDATFAQSNEKNDTSVMSGEAYTVTTIDTAKLFSDRDLSGAYDASECSRITLSEAGCTADSKNVAVDGSIVTITGEGDYIVSGTLSDGMIIVDADKSEKVQLVLDGVDITSKTSAAIYVKKADKVFITLSDGTENRLKNGGAFEDIDDNHIDAVIFSKDDLTFNGTGTLIIDSPAAHGIVSKNELVITNGAYQISAAAHGMTGKDSVAIAGGSFQITAGKDAIQSKNDDDDTLGFVYIADGEFVLSAGSDGISALNEISIAGGTVTVQESYEGLEARLINISGGEIDITSSDDGLNATDKRASASADTAQNTDMAAKMAEKDHGNADLSAKATDEDFDNADMPAKPTDEDFDNADMPAKLTEKDHGNVDMPAKLTEKDHGNVDMPAKTADGDFGKREDTRDTQTEHTGDDGEGRMKGFQGGRGGFGGGMGDTQADANINISGGIVRINAEGDGVDSNGYLTVSGGKLYVTGSSSGKDGALDYGIDASISGGIVVAAGQSGMAQNFGAGSTQGTILVNTQQQNAAGSEIALFDSTGRKLVAWTMEKDYNSVVVSCPDIREGNSYTIQTGEITTEIVMDSLVYGDGFGFGGGRSAFQGGMPDFGNGERPEGMPEPPEFGNGERPEGMPEQPDFENGERPEGMPEPPEIGKSDT